MHSVTKYIGGHSDVVMGVVCTNDETIYTKIRFIQNGVGAVPSPFDCFLAHRGLKTLHVRMEAAARYVRLFLYIRNLLARVQYVKRLNLVVLLLLPIKQRPRYRHVSGESRSGDQSSLPRIKVSPAAYACPKTATWIWCHDHLLLCRWP